jgi:hypothetical protein
MSLWYQTFPLVLRSEGDEEAGDEGGSFLPIVSPLKAKGGLMARLFKLSHLLDCVVMRCTPPH